MTAMNPDRQPKQVHASDGRTGRRRGAQSEILSAPAGLDLKSLNRTVSVTQALSNPDVLVLLGEDCCWQAATDDWRLRRPPLWHHGERKAWRAEGRALQDKLHRLQEFGTEIGLPAHAPTGRLRARFGHGRS